MSKRMEVKVYLVLQRVNLPKAGEPTEKVIDGFLTRGAAEDVVNRIPGTRIQKLFAKK